MKNNLPKELANHYCLFSHHLSPIMYGVSHQIATGSLLNHLQAIDRLSQATVLLPQPLGHQWYYLKLMTYSFIASCELEIRRSTQFFLLLTKLIKEKILFSQNSPSSYALRKIHSWEKSSNNKKNVFLSVTFRWKLKIFF